MLHLFDHDFVHLSDLFGESNHELPDSVIVVVYMGKFCSKMKQLYYFSPFRAHRLQLSTQLLVTRHDEKSVKNCSPVEFEVRREDQFSWMIHRPPHQAQH